MRAAHLRDASEKRGVAWYAAMRERHSDLDDDIFGPRLRQKSDLQYGGLELVFTPEVDHWIDRKWMNRGDAVLVECLTETPDTSIPGGKSGRS